MGAVASSSYAQIRNDDRQPMPVLRAGSGSYAVHGRIFDLLRDDRASEHDGHVSVCVQETQTEIGVIADEQPHSPSPLSWWGPNLLNCTCQRTTSLSYLQLPSHLHFGYKDFGLLCVLVF